jgi:hypothetical protein
VNDFPIDSIIVPEVPAGVRTPGVFVHLSAPWLDEAGGVLDRGAGGDVAPIPEGVVPISLDADYLIVTYSFTAANGTDLDTRTRLLAPVETSDVGWGDPNANPRLRFDKQGFDEQVPWLEWGGDNMDNGVESVVIYANTINNSYPGKNIDVELRCNWYEPLNESENGNMSVDIVAYKGGTISKVRFVNAFGTEFFSFVNTGGQQVTTISRAAHVTSNIADDVDGETVGTFRYNRTNKTFQWL